MTKNQTCLKHLITNKTKEISIMKILILILLSTVSLFAAGDKVVLKEFEKKVTTFTKFFTNSADLIDQSKCGTSSNEEYYYQIRFYSLENVDNVLYDVQKTNSIISKYIGTIESDFTLMINHDLDNSFVNLDSCLNNYKPVYKNIITIRYKFVYIYSDNKWKLKSILDKDGSESSVLTDILVNQQNGQSEIPTDKRIIKFNKPWNVLK